MKIKIFVSNLRFVEAPFLIFANLEGLIKKISGNKNNPEKLSSTIVSEHILWGCLMSAICGFDGIKSKHDVNRATLYAKVL